jgi:hypothetical protein
MNSDFKDLLRNLHECEVRYLVAGGCAVIHHSQPRYTKDINIWLDWMDDGDGHDRQSVAAMPYHGQVFLADLQAAAGFASG